MSETLRYRRLESEWARLTLRGADRVRFLGGMATCDIKNLSEGSGAYGALLTVKGKVIADFVVSQRGESGLLLLVRAQVAQRVCEALEHYIIVDDVVVQKDSAELAHLGVYGDSAAVVLLGDSSASLTPYHHREQAGVTIIATRELGEHCFQVIGPAESVRAIEAQLVAAGATELSEAESEVRRVEAGRPRCGIDFDEERLPQEASLEDALCFTKGCFLGQEVVVRLRDRGQLNRKLMGLRLAGDELPTAIKLSHPTRPQAGELTSVVRSPRFGIIALGYVHRSCWEPGTQLDLVDAEGHSLGRTATVTTPPFAVA